MGEEDTCNSEGCPVDCVGAWEEWSDCSKTCGGGTMSRSYSVKTMPENGGKGCPSNSEEDTCNIGACPVDCDGVWGPWSPCSKTCGDGTVFRSYSVATQPE